MGHIHVGTLPLTRQWSAFCRLLKDGESDPAALSRELAEAAQARLLLLRSDPNLVYCLWLLMRLASAARRPDFDEALRQLGIDVHGSSSTTRLLAQLSARLRDELSVQPGSGPFGEFASLALRSVLQRALTAEQPTLFPDDSVPLDQILRERTTPARLGHLVSDFFADFLSRILRFYVDKALPRYIGPDYGFATIAESEQLVTGIPVYAKTLSASTDYFAGRWFNLHDWTASGQLSREEVGSFVAHAIEKLQQSMAGGEVHA